MSTDLVPVPRQVMNYYKEIILSVDVMHVNRVSFLVTVCKHIHYGTATLLPDMTAESLLQVIIDLDKFYQKPRFKVELVLAAKQFQCLDIKLGEAKVLLNIAAQDKHVPEIECFIRVIKEQACCALSNTPFKKVPSRMIVGLIASSVFYINGLPWEGGVSMILSPMTIITGRKLDYKKHCQIPFGTYAQVLRRDTDNTMRKRTF